MDECADIVNTAPFPVCDIFQSVPHLGFQPYGCSVPVDRDVSAQKSRFRHIKFDYRFVCFTFHLSPASVFFETKRNHACILHPKVVFIEHYICLAVNATSGRKKIQRIFPSGFLENDVFF